MICANRSKILLRAFVVLLLGLLFEISTGHTNLKRITPLVKEHLAIEEASADANGLISGNYYSGYTKDTSILNTYGFPSYHVPDYDAKTYSSRIKNIDARVPLTYNKHVQAYIDLYLMRKRTLVAKVIGRSYDYFPLFDEVLAKHGMPAELRNLAIVESALSTEALSWCGAAGLWQFMPATGRFYDLKVTDDVDERKDPLLSTEAAAQYLKDLYNIYDDWLLAIAAYNCGPGNVRKAMKKAKRRRVKGRDFWSIKPYLPKETQDYVPAFIAATYMMNHYYDHNIKAIRPEYLTAQLKEVEVKESLTFTEVAKRLDITPEELAYFNPEFEKHGQVEIKKEFEKLQLPAKLEAEFLKHEGDIYAASVLKKK